MSLASDFYLDMQTRIDEAVAAKQLFLATVASVSGVTVRLLPLGSDEPSEELFGRLASYTPTAGEVVVCGWLNKKPFVLGALRSSGRETMKVDQGVWIGTTDVEAFSVADHANTKLFGVNASLSEETGRGVKVYNGTFLTGYDKNDVSTFNLDAANGNARFDGEASIDGVAANRVTLTPTDTTTFFQSDSDVLSTTNRSEYQNAMTRTIDLPAGTWRLVVLGGSMLRHSDGQRAAYRIHTGDQAGATIFQTFYPDSYTNGVVGHNSGGHRGSVTVRYQYRSSSVGTTTSKAPWLLVTMRRTG